MVIHSVIAKWTSTLSCQKVISSLSSEKLIRFRIWEKVISFLSSALCHWKTSSTFCHGKMSSTLCHYKRPSALCHWERSLALCHARRSSVLCHWKMSSTLCHWKRANSSVIIKWLSKYGRIAISCNESQGVCSKSSKEKADIDWMWDVQIKGRIYTSFTTRAVFPTGIGTSIWTGFAFHYNYILSYYLYECTICQTPNPYLVLIKVDAWMIKHVCFWLWFSVVTNLTVHIGDWRTGIM